MKLRIKKLLVILATAIGSMAAAAIHASIVWPEMAAKTRELDPVKAEWVRKPMIIETCIVFFSTANYLGRMLARCR